MGTNKVKVLGVHFLIVQNLKFNVFHPKFQHIMCNIILKTRHLYSKDKLKKKNKKLELFKKSYVTIKLESCSHYGLSISLNIFKSYCLQQPAFFSVSAAQEMFPSFPGSPFPRWSLEHCPRKGHCPLGFLHQLVYLVYP